MNQPISVCIQVNSVDKAILTDEERTSLLVTGIINSALALPTAALNALVIVSILTTPALVTPSYLLLVSLAFTDLLVGLLGQPLQSAMVLYYRNEDLNTYCYIRSASSAVMVLAAAASILTVTAIAVDRYLAIRLKIQYRSVVTVSRVKRILVAIWGLSFLVTSLPFYTPMIPVSIFGASGILLCLFVTVMSYVMSFKALTKHCAQIQGHGHQQPNSTSHSNVIDVVKYKNLLNTMLIILAFIILCYSFIAVVVGMYSHPNHRRSVIWGLLSIVGLNSTFNPVICMTRMGDLRRVCSQTLRKHLRFR